MSYVPRGSYEEFRLNQIQAHGATPQVEYMLASPLQQGTDVNQSRLEQMNFLQWLRQEIQRIKQVMPSSGWTCRTGPVETLLTNLDNELTNRYVNLQLVNAGL